MNAQVICKRAIATGLMLAIASGSVFASSCCDHGSSKVSDGKKEAAKSTVTSGWDSTQVYSYKSGEWVLKIEYLQKGSRSEGQKGTLFKAGKVVEGKQAGDQLETSLGKLKYYGSEHKTRWALAGWNFADRKQVKHSSLIMVKEKGTEETTKGEGQ